MTKSSLLKSGNSISIDGLSVNIDGRELIKPVKLNIPVGSTAVIIGPNGAGKSTFLKCFTGEVRFTGQIFYPVLPSTRRWRLGYVPQQVHVDNGLPLRVDEFLAASMQYRPLWLGISKSCKKKVHTLLKLTNSEKLADQTLGSLSGGELRRVLLAHALSCKPNLLLLDEPEAGVDMKGELEFWKILKALQEKIGFTEIIVSHNLSLAAHFATMVICMQGGEVMAAGSPEEALNMETLHQLFGMPIHLYPAECDKKCEVCTECGALCLPPHCHEKL